MMVMPTAAAHPADSPLPGWTKGATGKTVADNSLMLRQNHREKIAPALKETLGDAKVEFSAVNQGTELMYLPGESAGIPRTDVRRRAPIAQEAGIHSDD